MSVLDSERARQIGRLGGLAKRAAHDPKAYTRPAIEGRWRSYVRQVLAADPALTDEAEIQARARALQLAHMLRMSMLASEKARQKREGAAR